MVISGLNLLPPPIPPLLLRHFNKMMLSSMFITGLRMVCLLGRIMPNYGPKFPAN